MIDDPLVAVLMEAIRDTGCEPMKIGQGVVHVHIPTRGVTMGSLSVTPRLIHWINNDRIDHAVSYRKGGGDDDQLIERMLSDCRGWIKK